MIDKGVVVELGKHDELIAKNGLYAHLWSKQKGGIQSRQIYFIGKIHHNNNMVIECFVCIFRSRSSDLLASVMGLGDGYDQSRA